LAFIFKTCRSKTAKLPESRSYLQKEGKTVKNRGRHPFSRGIPAFGAAREQMRLNWMLSLPVLLARPSQQPKMLRRHGNKMRKAGGLKIQMVLT
jgi:hypothetical protein